jgi:hypothetical protein
MKTTRETCIFYKSIYDAINMLQNDAEKAQIYDAIFNYSFNFIEPNLSGTCLMIWKLIYPVLSKGNINYINGSKPKVKAKPKRNRSETEANNKPIESQVEAYKDKDIDKDKDKENDIDKDKDYNIPSPSVSDSPVKGKHIFKKSPYHSIESFAESFIKTKCFQRYPSIDIELLHEDLCAASASNLALKYNNWVAAARNWVERNPNRYSKTPSEKTFSRSSKGIHL